MVSVQRATSLYYKLAMGEKLTPQEKEELDEYASRFIDKQDRDAEDLLKDL